MLTAHGPLQTAPQLTGIHSVPFDDLKPMPREGYTEVIAGGRSAAQKRGHPLQVEPELVEA